MENKKDYPLYLGGSPCDGTTYRLPIHEIPEFNGELKAEGVEGSKETIKTFLENGHWHIVTPIWKKNPRYLKFKATIYGK